MDLRDRQYEYEIQADTEAAAAKLEKLKAGAKEGQLELPRAQRFVGSAFQAVKQFILDAQATQTRGRGGVFKGWLRAVPPDIAAVIAIRECIRLCTSHTMKGPATAQALGTTIGRLYELEIRIREATKVNPIYMEKIDRQVKERNTTSKKHLKGVYKAAYLAVMKDAFDSDLTNTEAMHLGKFGLDACLQAGIVELVRTTASKGTLVYYELNPEVFDFLNGYNEKDVRNVLAIEAGAMMCAPDPWTNLADGGYLSVRRKANAPLLSLRNVRKGERPRLRELFTAERLPTVFKAANYLQAQPFQIHLPTLEAIKRLWVAGGGVLGVPRTNTPERPPFPYDPTWDKEKAPPEEVAVVQTWKRKAAEYYDQLREWRGKVREVGGFLRAAAKNQAPMWFPVYLDRRGRLYYRGVPNPQGSDLSKAVLHFSEKKPLLDTGLFWLKVHVANSYGFDKCRMAQRAQWTEDNWEAIERSLDAPEDYPDLWGAADSPWCMYAAAYELREAYRSGNPKMYRTGIPIHKDATCSGIQHYAALLKDERAAKYVNLIDPQDGSPKADIYSRVSRASMESVTRDLKSAVALTAAHAALWHSMEIPRNLAKKPVMTFVYSATLMGTTHYVRDYVETEMPTVQVDDKGAYYVYQYLAKKLFTGIKTAVPSAVSGMNWLRKVAQSKPNGERMEWRSPTGFPVQHDYQDFAEVEVKLRSCGLHKIMVREYLDGTRKYAMANAISPNFVHALDAAHMTFTACAMHDAGKAMVAIHDSFGTHPCDVDDMDRIIREQFVKMYAEPHTIINNFIADVGTTLEPPTLGNLDINTVLTSEYFFS